MRKDNNDEKIFKECANHRHKQNAVSFKIFLYLTQNC